ncbi:MAG: hypothetical protein DRJ68_06590 [Thermoprotei archaeon]|nr:MAG: hypothetical protein DRJ68_06590 [Thermoprotei archaeon]
MENITVPAGGNATIRFRVVINRWCQHGDVVENQGSAFYFKSECTPLLEVLSDDPSTPELDDPTRVTIETFVQVTLGVEGAPEDMIVASIDGVNYTLPVTLSWVVGSEHVVKAYNATGVFERLLFSCFKGLVNSTNTTITIKALRSGLITLSYYRQFYLNVSSPYSSTYGSGWYNEGSQAYFGVADSVVLLADGCRAECRGFYIDGSYERGCEGYVIMDSPHNVSFCWVKQFYLAVSSPYGAVYGSGWYDEGSRAEFYVLDDLVEIDEGSRAICVGFYLDGSYRAGSSGVVVMDSPHLASFRWVKQFFLNVSSPYGTTYGSGWYDEGSQAEFRVEPQLLYLGDRARCVCIGYELDGCSFNGSKGLIYMDSPHNVSFCWVKQFYVEARLQCEEAGFVEGSGWYDEGSRAYLEASLKPGYELTSWLVDGSLGPRSRSLNLTVLRPTTAIALLSYRVSVGISSPVDLEVGLLVNGSPTTTLSRESTVELTFNCSEVVSIGVDDAVAVAPGSKCIADVSEVTVSGPTSLTFNYTLYHVVSASSSYGSVRGAGLYPNGSLATIAVEPTTVEVEEGVVMEFTGWTGDLTSKDPVVEVVVDRPINLTAMWSKRLSLTIALEGVERASISLDGEQAPIDGLLEVYVEPNRSLTLSVRSTTLWTPRGIYVFKLWGGVNETSSTVTVSLSKPLEVKLIYAKIDYATLYSLMAIPAFMLFPLPVLGLMRRPVVSDSRALPELLRRRVGRIVISRATYMAAREAFKAIDGAVEAGVVKVVDVDEALAKSVARGLGLSYEEASALVLASRLHASAAFMKSRVPEGVQRALGVRVIGLGM